MPDDRLYDAINLFKYSSTGLGARQIDGPPAHRDRYRTLARQVDAELWRCWAADDIGFVQLPSRIGSIRYGESLRVERGFDISVNTCYEPSRDDYASPVRQARVAATSVVLAHEAVHLVSGWELVPEEILCRTLQLLYFQDALLPRQYRSRVTGTTLTAQLLPLDDHLADMIRDNTMRLDKLRLGQLVDQVLSIGTYRRALTATFARDSLDWWGGPRNRWPATRAMYVAVLAAAIVGFARNSDAMAGSEMARTLNAMTSYLEAFQNPADWLAGRWALGDITVVRRAYASHDSRVPAALMEQHRHALRAVGARIGETLV